MYIKRNVLPGSTSTYFVYLVSLILGRHSITTFIDACVICTRSVKTVKLYCKQKSAHTTNDHDDDNHSDGDDDNDENVLDRENFDRKGEKGKKKKDQ